MPDLTRLALISMLFSAGCSDRTSPPATPPAVPSKAPSAPTAPNAYVLYTAEKTVPERFVFGYRDGELFVQLVDSEEGDNPARKQYLRRNLPSDLDGTIRTWFDKQQTATRMERGGEIKSNGPVALTRHEIGYHSSRGHGWSHFIEDDQTRELLAAVKSAVVQAEFAVENPPAWVEEDERVRNDFFGTGEPP